MKTPQSNALPATRSTFGLPGERAQWSGFSPTTALLAVLVVVAVVGSLAWAAATGQAPPSRQPRVFGGSLVLDDYRPLTVVDVATGSVTVQLEGVYQQVSAPGYNDVQAVTTSAGTVLVNRLTGTFNMLGKDDYVLGPATSGISLGPLPGSHAAAGFADGQGAYIVRYGPRSTVSLVDATTVEAGAQAQATRSPRPVRPVGFALLDGPAVASPGATVVAGGALWALVRNGRGCRLEEVGPSALAPQGLRSRTRAEWPGPCSAAALEAAGGTVGLVRPGRLVSFVGARARSSAAPGTAAADAFLPVRGASGQLLYLVHELVGWYLLAVPLPAAPTSLRPVRLTALGRAARPAVPALSGGLLYTLDRAQPGQPTLWTINQRTGAMRPVPGAPTYPAKSTTEKAGFGQAQVLVDGPRVVFNNPESLLAVIVFTDGAHPPVVVDKSTAVVVSAAGPGDANVRARRPRPHGSHRPKTSPGPVPTSTTPTTVAQPVSQPVTPQVNCATTSEKPYEPVITSVVPADQAVLVDWSYHLLSEQDCLPTTWSVAVNALGGAAQPSRPEQVVNGQQQWLFSGLRPATTYQVVVTAYINRQATASTPWRFRTTAVGPAAPAHVVARPDGRGGWLVSWTACNGASCLVPAARWVVTGAACAGSVVGQPPVLTVPGGHRSVTVTGANGALLGTSLGFSVQGVAADGLRGAPASSANCTTAWQPPSAAAIQLLAAGAATGNSVAAHLQVAVAPGASPQTAFGGSPVSFTYAVGGRQLGPTTASEVVVGGLAADQRYQATVTVVPLSHPRSAVTVTSAAFSRDLQWPSGMSLQVSGVVGADPNRGTAVATVQGLPPGDFRATGLLTCGSEALPVTSVLNGPQFEAALNLDQMGGQCRLRVVLADRAQPGPYGVPSQPLEAGFGIGTPRPYRFQARARATCAHNCTQIQVSVGYTGPGQPAGTDWQVEASSPDGCSAVSPLRSAASFPTVLDWPTDCQPPVITVSWVYLGQSATAQAGFPGLPLLAPPPPVPASAGHGARPTTTSTTTSTTVAPPSTAAPPTLAPVPTTTSGHRRGTTTAPTSPPPAATTLPAPCYPWPACLEATTVPAGGTPPATSTTVPPRTTTTLTSGTTTTTAPTTTTTAPATTTTAPATTTTPSSTTTTTTAPASTTTSSSTTTTTAPTTTTTAPATTTTAPATTTTAPATTTTAPGATTTSTSTTTTAAPSTSTTTTRPSAGTTTTTSAPVAAGLALMGSVGPGPGAHQEAVPAPLVPTTGGAPGLAGPAWYLLAGLLGLVPVLSFTWARRARRRPQSRA